jgi:hypothetical protein
MSTRATRWVLWIALFATLPVPFFVTAPGFAPTLRIAFLALLLGAVYVSDGGPGVTAMMTVFPVVQTVVYGALLYLLARLVAGLVERVASPRFRPLLALGLVAVLVGASFFEIYRTPHSSGGPYSNLVHLLE